jgi:hypothetical protein
MQSPLPSNPYARPLSARAYAWLVAVATVLALLAALAFVIDQGLAGNRRAVKEVAAAFIAPYQELFLASLPGEEEAEYVVFLTADADAAAVDRFLAGGAVQRIEREGLFDGLMVVKQSGAGPEGLERLRAQPWVKFTVRNQGVFFCH